jgi:hypothetical protein
VQSLPNPGKNLTQGKTAFRMRERFLGAPVEFGDLFRPQLRFETTLDNIVPEFLRDSNAFGNRQSFRGD